MKKLLLFITVIGSDLFRVPTYAVGSCPERNIVCCVNEIEWVGNLGVHGTCWSWVVWDCLVCPEDQAAFDQQCQQQFDPYARASVSTQCQPPHKRESEKKPKDFNRRDN